MTSDGMWKQCSEISSHIEIIVSTSIAAATVVTADATFFNHNLYVVYFVLFRSLWSQKGCDESSRRNESVPHALSIFKIHVRNVVCASFRFFGPSFVHVVSLLEVVWARLNALNHKARAENSKSWSPGGNGNCLFRCEWILEISTGRKQICWLRLIRSTILPLITYFCIYKSTRYFAKNLRISNHLEMKLSIRRTRAESALLRLFCYSHYTGNSFGWWHFCAEYKWIGLIFLTVCDVILENDIISCQWTRIAERPHCLRHQHIQDMIEW